MEIEKSFDKDLLRIPGFKFESECNSLLLRVGLYISNEINYNHQLTQKNIIKNTTWNILDQIRNAKIKFFKLI